MKTNKFSITLSRTAALAGLIACAAGCAKKNHEPPQPQPPAPEPQPTNAAASGTNAVAATNAPAAPVPAVAAAIVTNIPAAPEITNPPPAETTITAPETTTLAETNVPGHNAVVEMPANPPVAPTNFYPATITSQTPNAICLKPVGGEEGSANFFLRFRAGYEHIYHGDNNDSYWLSAKFYAYGDGLREQAGKNGWLIPDADAEISSSVSGQARQQSASRQRRRSPFPRGFHLAVAPLDRPCVRPRQFGLSLLPTPGARFGAHRQRRL